MRISGSFAALVLAMALLGPVPAAAIAVVAVVFDHLITKRCWRELLWNATAFVCFSLLGGWLLSLVGREDPIAFAACVVLIYLVTNAINFAAVATYLRLTGVLSVSEAYSTVYRTDVALRARHGAPDGRSGLQLRSGSGSARSPCWWSCCSSSTTSRARA